MGGWFDKTVYNPIIFITDYYDFTEKQFMDIMVHEMIHYYLAYIGEDMKCKHGKKFKKIAEKLNQTYNLNIVIDVDLSQYKRRAGTPSLSYWFVKKIYCV
jgi:predicted SprT family Zn-dependent metalloprotease